MDGENSFLLSRGEMIVPVVSGACPHHRMPVITLFPHPGHHYTGNIRTASANTYVYCVLWISICLSMLVLIFLKDFCYTEGVVLRVGVSELKLVNRTSLFRKEGRKQYFYGIYKKKPADLCFVPSLYC